MLQRNSLNCLLLLMCSLLAYANAFSAKFFQDDYQTLLGDKPPALYLWSFENVFTDNLNTRGFSMWTFAANEALLGSTAFSYHVGSVLIHLLASLLVYDVIRRTLEAYWGRSTSNPLTSIRDEAVVQDSSMVALFSAAVFAVHPIHSQAVTYLSQRSEALMGLMFLLTVSTLIRSARCQSIPWKVFWLMLSVFSCLLGMRAKEAMIVAPLLSLWYDRVFISVSWKDLLSRRGIYHLALWATLFFNSSWQSLVPKSPQPEISTTTQQLTTSELNTEPEKTSSRAILTQKGARLSRWDYFRTQPSIILKYVWLVFWPEDFCFDRGHTQPPPDWVFFCSTALLTVAFLATIYAIFKAPAWAFLGAWFFINLGPRSSFIPLENPYFEYRMYLPVLSIIVPFACLVVMISKKLNPKKQQAAPFYWFSLIVISGTLAAVTYHRNNLYTDPVLLWRDTVQKAPNNGRAHTNLARALLMTHADESAQEALKIGKRATELSPESALAFHFYGLSLQRLEKNDEAIEAFNQAIKNDPKFMHPYLNLGNIYSKTDPLKAFEYYTEAMALAPDDPAVQTNYATTMLLNDIDVATAERILIDLANSRPTHIDSRLNLGLYYANSGRYREGIDWGEKALRVSPNHQSAIELIKFCQQKLSQARE